MFHAEFPGVSHDWSDPKSVLLALTHEFLAAAPGVRHTGSIISPWNTRAAGCTTWGLQPLWLRVAAPLRRRIAACEQPVVGYTACSSNGMGSYTFE